MVTYMKLKKLLIISLSFILTSTFLITPLSASSTVCLGKYDFNNGETPEITMTETYSKIIFTAYFDDGEEIYSYVDKNTGKVYLNENEVIYKYNEGTQAEPTLPTISTYANIDSTPVNVVTGMSIDFAPLIEATAAIATSIALAHFGVTASSLLAKLGKTVLSKHWTSVVDIVFDGLIGAIGGYGVSKILNITFKYDLQRTRGLIYLNGGNVPVTGYRYANYRATIKVAGKSFSGSSGKYGGWWSSSKPYSVEY
ncbi:hypothetical protein [Thomasclavelia ramosa]|uniref:hypothetical protein n=1 Tax=Thomasclavelia ramosa TaxID=1547 RepID=UPI0040693AD2